MTEEEQSKSSIETLVKSYETALNKRDTDALMDLFGANPVFIVQNSQPMIGRDAVRKFTDRTFRTIRQFDERFTLHEVEASGDVAWGRTSAVVRVHDLASGKWTEAVNNQLFVLRRENGAWKIHRFMAVSDGQAKAS